MHGRNFAAAFVAAVLFASVASAEPPPPVDGAGAYLIARAYGRVPLGAGTIPVQEVLSKSEPGNLTAAIAGSLAYSEASFSAFPHAFAYAAGAANGSAEAGASAGYSFRLATLDAAAAQLLRTAIFESAAGRAPIRLSGYAFLEAPNAVDEFGFALTSASASIYAGATGPAYSFSGLCTLGIGCGAFDLDIGVVVTENEYDGLYTYDGVISLFASATTVGNNVVRAFADPMIGFDLDFLNNNPGIAELFTLTLSPGAVNASGRMPVYPAAAPSVPDAATWATMLAGFGAIGTVMRRRASRRRALPGAI